MEQTSHNARLLLAKIRSVPRRGEGCVSQRVEADVREIVAATRAGGPLSRHNESKYKPAAHHNRGIDNLM